jgi:uncharacterized protein YhaN
MKINKFTLERYGAISERSISIASDIGLTIIYGANEAGKSTSLEAIGDFLFGIPMRSTRGSLFGYEAMRISAEMTAADGSAYALTRAKRRSNSLSHANGTSAENQMAALLGAMTRERYERLFGLNHESLRDGGDHMLAADGEIGRLIVEAGGGLRDVMARLAEMERQAALLFDSRRAANRVFYQQLDRFNEADKAAKAASLTLENYQQAQKAVARAEQDLARLRQERVELESQAAKWQRITRVMPVLRLWDQSQAALAGYGDVADYPADFSQRITAALAARRAAADAFQAARDRRDQLHARRDALTIDAAISAATADIQTLSERALHIAKARADRPNRLSELEEGAAKLANLRRLLGLPDDADLLGMMPDAAALDHLRQLAEQKLALTPDLQALTERVADCRRDISVLDERITAAITAGYDRAPEASAALFGSLASQQAALDARAAQAKAAKAALAVQIQDLGFADAAELLALITPAEEDVRAEIKLVEQWQAERAEQAKAQRSAERRIADAARQIADLQASGPVASEQTIAEARQRRAAAWGAVKQAYVTGDAPDPVAARLAQADQLDAALAEADNLADRRAAEAERAAHLAQAQRSAAEAESEAKAAAAEIAAIDSQLEARRTAWQQSFPALCTRTPELAAALAFVQARQAALAEHQRLRDVAADLVEQAAQIAPLRDQLQRLQTAYGLEVNGDFAARVATVQQAITAREAAHGDYRRDQADHREKSSVLEGLTARLEALQQAEAEWQAAWPSAATALGLAADVTPHVATLAVTEWSSASGLLSAIAITQQRLKRMDADETALAADAGRLSAELGCAGDGVDSLALVQQLADMARHNSAQKQQGDMLMPDMEEAKIAARSAETALVEAQRAVADMAVPMGLIAEDEAALVQAAARSAERANIVQQLAELEQRARAAGDQQDIASLRAECEACDWDAAHAELSGLQSRKAQLEEAMEISILAEKSARDMLAQYASQSDVNRFIAEREAAAAEMHLALERHLELSLACDMVMIAMAKIRAEQQSPLIARAGHYFAAMTLGEFVGIEADVDDNGNPVVVGRRGNQERAHVQQMSDGTRDQLFLAFRLASIENYAAAAEPLPLIADDILVHFDDARSAATLEILAEFGQKQQILLFTHHQSVRDMAVPLAEQGRAQIIELERVAGL